MTSLGSTLPSSALAEEPARSAEEAQSALSDERFMTALELTDPLTQTTTAELLTVRAQAYSSLGFHSLAYWLSEAADEFGTSPVRDTKQDLNDNNPRALELGLSTDVEEDTLRRVQGLGRAHSSEEWEAQVSQAWKNGNCFLTAALSAEWATHYPETAAAHRLKGDAHRCTGAPRAALDAYEEVVKRDQADASLRLVIEGLASNLAVLDIKLAITPGRELPSVWLELPGQVLRQGPEPDGSLRFVDLPWGQELSLHVAGPGYATSVQAVAPFLIGETRAVEVALEPAGFGFIELASPPPAGVSIFAHEGGKQTQLEHGTSHKVTSGPLPIVVIGSSGQVTTEVVIAEDQAHLFDAMPWIPTSLRVSGLPAGATVRVFVEGLEDAVSDKSSFLAPADGVLDEATGVHIAPPLTLRSLVGGTGGLFLEHTTLGDAATVLMLEPGGANALQFRWRSMAGVPQVTARYLTWQEERQALITSHAKQRAQSVVGTILVGIVAGSLFGAAGATGRQLDEAQARGIVAAAQGQEGIGDLHDARADSANWERARNALLVGAATASAGMLVGVGLTFRIDHQGKAELLRYGEWGP